MHLVGVPVATGYKRGPSKQSAKTKVFTTESLAMLQDQMHQFARNQMGNHPDLFEEEELKKIERGRNTDFTKDYYIKQKAAQTEVLKDEINQKVEELNSLEIVMGELQQNTDKVEIGRAHV